MLREQEASGPQRGPGAAHREALFCTTPGAGTSENSAERAKALRSPPVLKRIKPLVIFYEMSGFGIACF